MYSTALKLHDALRLLGEYVHAVSSYFLPNRGPPPTPQAAPAKILSHPYPHLSHQSLTTPIQPHSPARSTAQIAFDTLRDPFFRSVSSDVFVPIYGIVCTFTTSGRFT